MARFADTHAQEIRDMVQDGNTISEIAEAFQVSYGTVASSLKQLGLKAKRANARDKRPADPKITEEELRKLYLEDDLTVNEIATLKGTSRQTVYNTLDRYGIPRQKKSKIYRMFNEERVREILGTGVTATEAARQLGVPVSTLRKYAKDKGIKTRNELYADALTEENLRKWYLDEKMSMTEIAERIGCNYNTVSHACKKYGIKKSRKEIHETMKATMRERYGVDYAMESPEIQAKMRYSRSDGFIEKVRECEQIAPSMIQRGATISEIADELGCSYKKTRGMLVDLGLFTPKGQSSV